MLQDAYIGLGSNMGDRVENLARALRMLDDLDDVQLIAISHVYESEPWGVTEQPWFVNAAARIRTSLPADQLLAEMQRIEREMGREPGERWGPRVIDLDILLYGMEEWASEQLTIPHPRMGERDFVVRPLLEVARKGLRYPDGRPISKRGWLGLCTNDLGCVPGFEQCRADTVEERGLSCDIEERPEKAAATPRDFSAWRTVGTTAGFGRIDTGGGSLAFKEAVLKENGITYAYDPHPPSEGFNPWSVGAQIRLKVPASEHERAMRVIREAEEVRAGKA